MKQKLIFGLASIMFLVSGASAVDTNTTTVFNQSDFTVATGETWTSDAFTAQSLENLSYEVDIDSNESLSAVLTGYNSSAETSNQSFDLQDGTGDLAIDNFSENTTTYVVDLEASNGTVSVLDLEITGTEGNETVSGVAGGGSGGLFTGSFFSGIPSFSEAISGISTAINNFFTGIGSFLGGLV